MILSLARADALAGMAVLIDVTLKGAAVLVMAGLADALLLRRSSAAMRHLLWSVAMAALLALPALALLAPGVRSGWLPDWSATLAGMAAQPQAYSPAPPSPTPEHATPVGTVAVTLVQVPAQALPPPAPIEPPAAPSPAWLTWAILTWAAGVGLLLTPLLGGLIAVAWRVRRAARIDEPAWQVLLGELRTELGISRPVRLLRARAGEAPMTWGVRHPAILLPPAADEWPQPCRRVVLVHELAHIRRGDCLTQLLARAVRAIHWHNPLAWLAVRNLRIQRERACDDVVLACGTKASDYASHLLEIVRSLRWPRPATMAAVAMARPSQFEGRLMAILDACRNRRPPGRSRTVWLCVLAAAMALSIASARSRSASPAAPAKAVSAPPASTQPTRAPKTGQGVVTILAAVPELPPDAATVQAPEAELPTPADLQPDPAADVLAPGDIVNISIMGLFTDDIETVLSRQISDTGMVDLAKLPGAVRLAGLTLEQARKEVVRAYADGHVMPGTPTVSILPLWQSSMTVNVAGAVEKPGQYPWAGPNMRLLDALALAGEVNQAAVQYVYVLRTPQGEQAAQAVSAPASASASSQPAGSAVVRARLIAINLEKLKSGDPRQNIVLHGRDTIMVPPIRRGEFYVMGGGVARPGVYSFTGRRVTVRQAMIAAGVDAAKLSQSESSRPGTSGMLLRHNGKDPEQATLLDLTDIIRGTGPDIYLEPNDAILIGLPAVSSMPATTFSPAPEGRKVIAVPPPTPRMR